MQSKRLNKKVKGIIAIVLSVLLLSGSIVQSDIVKAIASAETTTSEAKQQTELNDMDSNEAVEETEYGDDINADEIRVRLPGKEDKYFSFLELAFAYIELSGVKTNKDNPAEVTIIKDITVNVTATVPCNSYVVLDSQGEKKITGKTILTSNVFTILNNSTLEITPERGNSLIIDGDRTCLQLIPAPIIENSGELIINDNTTIKNGAASCNGGLIKNKNKMTMNGGILTSGTARNGGAIYNAGTCNIVGGVIDLNTSSGKGGAIYNAGNLSLSEVNIIRNEAKLGIGIYNGGYLGEDEYNLDIEGDNKSTIAFKENIKIDENNDIYLGTDTHIDVKAEISSSRVYTITPQRTVNGTLIARADVEDYIIESNFKAKDNMARFTKADNTIVIGMPDTPHITVEDIENQTYTGSEIEPDVVVRDKRTGVILTKDVDYEVEYKDNINVGKGIAAVTGINIYEGYIEKTFSITEKEITDVTGVEDKVYEAKHIEQDGLKVYSDDTQLSVADYRVEYLNNYDVGTATLKVIGIGNYSGTIEKQFEITRRDITKTSYILDQTFTGEEIRPDILVYSDGIEKYLFGDEDYTVEYSKNIFIGTAKVHVVGINNFIGELTTEFNIIPRGITSIEEIDDQEYTGSAICPQVIVYSAGAVQEKLIQGEDYEVNYSKNIDIGTAKVTVTGINNFTGQVEKEFKIIPQKINCVHVLGEYKYNGEEIRPTDLEVKSGDTVLKENDYEIVRYENNKNAGNNATVTVRGKGNYSDEETTGTFTIEKAEIIRIGEIVDQTWAGEPIIIKDLKVYAQGIEKELTEEVDFKASYINNDRAGTALVIVDGLGNFKNEQTKTFEILPATISKVEADTTDKTYTGGDIEPKVNAVYSGDTLLKENVDYTVSYLNNVNVGTAAKINIEGIGNYTGTFENSFNILQKTISRVDDIPDQVYKSKEVKPSVRVHSEGIDRLLAEEGEYKVEYKDNIEEGTNTATATITGINNFTGVIEKKFSIVKGGERVITRVENIEPYTYDGTEKEPKVTVYSGIDILEEDKDYDIIGYYNNINAGIDTATVVIAGKNDYATGEEIDKSFTIKQAQITEVEDIPNQQWTGNEIEATFNVYADGIKLDKEDYTVQYLNNEELGTAFIGIVANNNFTGTRYQTFNIIPRTDAVIQPIGNYTYTGSPIEPHLTVKDSLNNTLLEGRDYKTEYFDNINAGTATAKIVCMGNYAGEPPTANFIINKSHLPIPDEIPDMTYTGKEIKPDVKIRGLDGNYLKMGVDYKILEYKDNINAGVNTASVTIESIGDGNYRPGENLIHFTITRRPITSIDDIPNQKWTGKAVEPEIIVRSEGYGNNTLKKDIDYTVTYTNNVASGGATVTISATGNFSGKLQKTFLITNVSAEATSGTQETWNLTLYDDSVPAGEQVKNIIFVVWPNEDKRKEKVY